MGVTLFIIFMFSCVGYLIGGTPGGTTGTIVGLITVFIAYPVIGTIITLGFFVKDEIKWWGKEIGSDIYVSLDEAWKEKKK